MIKLFRKIRQNLLMENRMGKYLKYAIGEIILVVIGILIALQINNWNEERKDHKTSIGFLKGIRQDLKKDIKLADSVLQFNYKSISIISSIDSIFHKKSIYEAETHTDFFIDPDTLFFEYVFFRPQSFRPINGTYKTLIADGKTTLIENKELLDKIQLIYNENHERTTSNYEVIKDLELNIGLNYSKEKQIWSYSDLKRAKNDKIFFDLANFTNEKYWYSFNLLRLIKNSQDVINLINKELAND